MTSVKKSEAQVRKVKGSISKYFLIIIFLVYLWN